MPPRSDAALARGRWDLDYAAKKDVGGLFTLVLRRIDDGWRIVHDHTSVDGWDQLGLGERPTGAPVGVSIHAMNDYHLVCRICIPSHGPCLRP